MRPWVMIRFSRGKLQVRWRRNVITGFNEIDDIHELFDRMSTRPRPAVRLGLIEHLGPFPRPGRPDTPAPPLPAAQPMRSS